MIQDNLHFPSSDPPSDYRTDAQVAARLAPKSLRFANVLIDSLIWGFGFGSLKIWLSLKMSAAGMDPGFLATYNPMWVALEAFVYYMVFETSFGWTPGKLITGTRVVRCDGTKARAGDIARRTLIRLVPINALSFLFSESSGWHDVWTDTRVIRKT